MAMPDKGLDVEHDIGMGIAGTEEQSLRVAFIDGTAGICNENACLDVFNADGFDVFF